jgi:hypothetical protein
MGHIENVAEYRIKIEISATRKIYIEHSTDNFAVSISGSGLMDNPAILPLLLHWLHCNL